MIEGSQDPSFDWQSYYNTTDTPVTLKSNTAWTISEVQSLARNQALTTDQIFEVWGISEDEVIAAVMGFDAGYG